MLLYLTLACVHSSLIISNMYFCSRSNWFVQDGCKQSFYHMRSWSAPGLLQWSSSCPSRFAFLLLFWMIVDKFSCRPWSLELTLQPRLPWTRVLLPQSPDCWDYVPTTLGFPLLFECVCVYTCEYGICVCGTCARVWGWTACLCAEGRGGHWVPSSFTSAWFFWSKASPWPWSLCILARPPTRKPQCWDHALLNVGAGSKPVLLPAQQMLSTISQVSHLSWFSKSCR